MFTCQRRKPDKLEGELNRMDKFYIELFCLTLMIILGMILGKLIEKIYLKYFKKLKSEKDN